MNLDDDWTDGIDTTTDMNSYESGGTGIASCLPPWAVADGNL
jgi:hypothetical protein